MLDARIVRLGQVIRFKIVHPVMSRHGRGCRRHLWQTKQKCWCVSYIFRPSWTFITWWERLGVNGPNLCDSKQNTQWLFLKIQLIHKFNLTWFSLTKWVLNSDSNSSVSEVFERICSHWVDCLSSSKRYGPLMGEESQICWFGVCLLTTYYRPSVIFRFKTPSEYVTSSKIGCSEVSMICVSL